MLCCERASACLAREESIAFFLFAFLCLCCDFHRPCSVESVLKKGKMPTIAVSYKVKADIAAPILQLRRVLCQTQLEDDLFVDLLSLDPFDGSPHCISLSNVALLVARAQNFFANFVKLTLSLNVGNPIVTANPSSSGWSVDIPFASPSAVQASRDAMRDVFSLPRDAGGCSQLVLPIGSIPPNAPIRQKFKQGEELVAFVKKMLRSSLPHKGDDALTVSQSINKFYVRVDGKVVATFNLHHPVSARPLTSVVRQPRINVASVLAKQKEAEFLSRAVGRASAWIASRKHMTNLPKTSTGWCHMLQSFSKVPVQVHVDDMIQGFLKNGFLEDATVKVKTAEKKSLIVRATGTFVGKFKYCQYEPGKKLQEGEKIKIVPVYEEREAFLVKKNVFGSKFEPPIAVENFFGDQKAFQARVRRILKHTALTWKANAEGKAIIQKTKFLALLEAAAAITVTVPSESIVEKLVSDGVLRQRGDEMRVGS